MEKSGTKDAAEALLRELPSVMGAFVREDVFGHPREIHLLISPGPSPRHLARDVRDLLEERLGVPVDQRVISIAQLAAEPAPQAGAAAASSGSPGVPAEPADSAASATDPPTTDMDPAAQAPSAEPRLRFDAAETSRQHGQLTVRVVLARGDETFVGESTQMDAQHGRLRSGAGALLEAANHACAGRGRFALEEIARVVALGRDFVLLTVIASAPRLGRRPLTLAGAQLIDAEEEVAAALAALKAVNRVLPLVLDAASLDRRA
jgi:hypothetical protein